MISTMLSVVQCSPVSTAEVEERVRERERKERDREKSVEEEDETMVRKLNCTFHV